MADKDNGQNALEGAEELSNVQSADTFGGFSQHEMVNALKMLYEMSKEKGLENILIRADIPDQRFLFGNITTLNKCKFFKNWSGYEKCKLYLIGQAAVNKPQEYRNRTTQVIRAIIGEVGKVDKSGTHFMDKVKHHAGIGDGQQQSE